MHPQKYIDWSFLAQYASVHPLIAKFKSVGLYDLVAHKCNCNDTVIRQFYATVEIDFQTKQIKWMTNSRAYYATFAEFAQANEIDYEKINDELDVLEEDVLPVNEWLKYYVDNAYKRRPGTVTGLLPMSVVINKIARATFFSKGGNSDTIRDHYWNIIEYLMEEITFDVVLLIMKQVENISMHVQPNLYFAPYIMSMIIMKTNFPSIALTTKHAPYQPFGVNRTFLMPPPEETAAQEDEHGAPAAPDIPQPPPGPPPVHD